MMTESMTSDGVLGLKCPADGYPEEVDEVHHRIANSLQLIAAMVSLEARGLSDAIAVASLERTRQRIGAIASVHRQLCRSPVTGTVNLAAYLIELGQNLQDSFADASAGRSIEVDAIDLLVSSANATSVGIIVAELVTNACKHAYPGGTPGVVQVKLEPVNGAGFRLTVEDHGLGLAHRSECPGAGIGHRLVKVMADRLSGHLNCENAQPGCRYLLHVASGNAGG